MFNEFEEFVMMDALQAKNLVDNSVVLKIKQTIEKSVDDAIKQNKYSCEIEIPFHTRIEVIRQIFAFLKNKGYKQFINSCCDSCGNKTKYIVVSWREAK